VDPPGALDIPGREAGNNPAKCPVCSS